MLFYYHIQILKLNHTHQGSPKDRHTTAANFLLTPSSHTVPHLPSLYTSTRPSYLVAPPTSRTTTKSHSKFGWICGINH